MALCIDPIQIVDKSVHYFHIINNAALYSQFRLSASLLLTNVARRIHKHQFIFMLVILILILAST